MDGYAISFKGKVFTPDGRAMIGDVEAHNRELESKEIEWLQTHPESAFLYVKTQKPPTTCGLDSDQHYAITTWLGTVVSQWVKVGRRVHVGFGYAYRRSINARIFGVRYVGWYMESSGNYCRLRKAKVQS